MPAETFEEMVTAETVGITKPHPEGFRYILRKTGLPAEQHLMIGDREGVDLVPAKALGMKTCLVWAKNSSSIANVSLPTVYGVANLVG
ncbi:MAG: HAD superfamily (Subfamily IA) hydrolase, TIGR02253 [Parcubacteria group bacterium GW2011_GWA1_49_11]|nr:MAG: HAD superfamily (Subfamily IA) hydrolase, TIGR02253 [Parcubacteria group bacterium GW2011_GWA1_49_11]